MLKKLFCFTLIFVLSLSILAEASVLGTTMLYGYTYEVGDGLNLHQNRFYSDQEGVGNQTENYFEYTPNKKTRPIVTLGKYVYGGEDINEAYSYLLQNDIRTLAGINGDFFSLSTGVPNAHVVIDKKITTTDERVLPALGIKENGEGFISDFQIITKMKHNDTEIVIPFINKYLQKWGYYMYDSNYNTKITPQTEGTFVTFDINEGAMELGDTINATVLSIDEYVLDVETNTLPEKEILENQLVIALSKEADQSLLLPLGDLGVGDTVEFSFSTNNDELWSEATHILASEAGQIVSDGIYCGQELAGASPRTAVGITDTGKMIFYTIDGRQQGHSFGVRIPTLAERMMELGCVDVLNLDGGGSTTISGSLFGGDFGLLNIPSDGSLRNDSTYIFFENTSEKTGEFSKLFLYPETLYIKSGSKGNFQVSATDDGYFPVAVPQVNYEVLGNSYLSHDGMFRAVGDETAQVIAEAYGITQKGYIKSVQTPDYIKVVDNNGKEVTSISLEVGEEIDLNILAYYNSVQLISQDNAYLWEVVSNSGKITEQGIFTMGEGTGKILIRAGEKQFEIPINADPFSDISSSWARHYINDLYKEGVVNGFSDENGNFLFKPSNYVTKSEMATMLSRSLKLDTKAFENTALPFSDIDTIPTWAIPHIKALYGKGIIKGTLTDDGNVYFYPQNEVNRAEIFTIVGRILEAESQTPCPFSDREEIPDWAVSYIDALYEKGMINGYDDNQLKVFNSITRAEISKIIMKALFE